MENTRKLRTFKHPYERNEENRVAEIVLYEEIIDGCTYYFATITETIFSTYEQGKGVHLRENLGSGNIVYYHSDKKLEEDIKKSLDLLKENVEYKFKSELPIK